MHAKPRQPESRSFKESPAKQIEGNMGIATTCGVIIVGGSLAGVTCAQAPRTEGFDGTILIVGDEWYLPYNRPPSSKRVLLNQ
jgi:hypothetical protein